MSARSGLVRHLLVFILFACASASAGALEETLTFTVTGGSEGADQRARVGMQVAWGGKVSPLESHAAEGIQVQPGFRGKPEIRMAEAEYRAGDATDLLLHFNRDPALEAAPGYAVASSGLELSSQLRKLGRSGGLGRGEPGGLVLEAGEGSLFAPGSHWGDFSIEFWLYPVTLDEGEQVVGWEGLTWLDGRQVPQAFTVGFRDRRLVWDFVNVFGALAPSGDRLARDSARVQLSTKRELVPRTWQHHLLRYRAASGRLEYLVDGRPEDIVHATATGREGGQVLQPYIGERSKPLLRVGDRLNGAIDELRLSRARVADPVTDRYAPDGSWVVFKPIDFRDIGAGSKVLTINADWTHPGTSDIAFYYKMDNRLGLAPRDDPAWRRFEPGKPITENNQGLYLFFKVELMADGSGTQSPGLQALKVTYQPAPPPPAPGGVVAEASADGTVTLRWNAVPVNDLQGYMVYYGTRPGQWFGESASFSGVAGSSPVDVGKVTSVTITGLERGRLYYFVVASYNESNKPAYGIHLKRSLSREVSARPAR